MQALIILTLAFGALIGTESSAHRPRMGGYINRAFDGIWATNTEHAVEIKEITDLATNRPGPYRLVVEFSQDRPTLRLILFKNDRQIERQIVKPFSGGYFNQRWVTYRLEADGLRFEVGINGAGSMPVNVYRNKSDAAAIMHGRAQLAGGDPPKCG